MAAVNTQLTGLSTKIEARAAAVWERYACPGWLKEHSLLVGRVATVIAYERASELGSELGTVMLAAYLHDVGRSPLLEGDGREHNDRSALVLAAEGLVACAEMARRHPVYAILRPATAPRTLGERIVYYADRRAGMEVLPLDERIGETARRHPRYAADIERARPLAHAVEAELFRGMRVRPEELAGRVAALWP